MNINLISLSLTAGLLAALLTGCASSTPSPASPEKVAFENVGPWNQVAPPGEMEVGWSDNGTSIRPLSEPGRERELVKPVTAGHHRGGLSVAPPTNSDGYAAKSAKKKPSLTK